LTLAQEQDLIRRAQQHDKAAAEQLIVNYEGFITQVAKKVAWFTGAKKSVEDLAQQGRLALYEKIFSYSCDFSARLSSYAFREIRRRMMTEACNSLEIVPLPANSHLHAAHRDYERGDDEEAILARYKMKKTTLAAVHRSTVPVDEIVETLEDEDDVEGSAFFSGMRGDVLWCWGRLDGLERLALSLLFLEPKDADKRCEALAISRKQLKVLETQALERLKTLVKEEEGT
jgi:RNA polymerase sigma factor (sigma-70 family)